MSLSFSKKQLAVLAFSGLGLVSLPTLADDYTIDTKGAHASINFAINFNEHTSFSGCNVEKFPQSKFVSKKVVVGADKNSFDIVGDFTLNGVTKSITIAAKKVGEGKDPWGGYRAGFEGTTELALKDFNIVFPLGPASETVKLSLNVEGVKKDEPKKEATKK